MMMSEVAIDLSLFRKFRGNARRERAFSSSPAITLLTLVLIASAACGHKKNRMVPVPAAPQPSPVKRNSPAPQAIPPPVLPAGYVEEGIASWYGIPFNGRHAADGEIYDMETLVAAHKLMPFNTWLRVTNLSNNKTVNVRIIDRGPFVEGRIIDLSKAAARQIDMIGPGTSRVRLEVMDAPRDVPANDFYGIQVGSFSVLANAEQARAQYAQKYGFAQLAVRNGPVTRWRVLVGKFSSVENARALSNVLSADNPDIFIVRLDETVVHPTKVPPPMVAPPPFE